MQTIAGQAPSRSVGNRLLSMWTIWRQTCAFTSITLMAPGRLGAMGIGPAIIGFRLARGSCHIPGIIQDSRITLSIFRLSSVIDPGPSRTSRRSQSATGRGLRPMGRPMQKIQRQERAVRPKGHPNGRPFGCAFLRLQSDGIPNRPFACALHKAALSYQPP